MPAESTPTRHACNIWRRLPTPTHPPVGVGAAGCHVHGGRQQLLGGQVDSLAAPHAG